MQRTLCRRAALIFDRTTKSGFSIFPEHTSTIYKHVLRRAGYHFSRWRFYEQFLVKPHFSSTRIDAGLFEKSRPDNIEPFKRYGDYYETASVIIPCPHKSPDSQYPISADLRLTSSRGECRFRQRLHHLPYCKKQVWTGLVAIAINRFASSCV